MLGLDRNMCYDNAGCDSELCSVVFFQFIYGVHFVSWMCYVRHINQASVLLVLVCDKNVLLVFSVF